MWNNIKRIDSSEGNVAKFVYTNDTAVAESVLYRYPTYEDRTVICCSTQSGCPVGCRFCGAGDNFVRSLSAIEIIEQVKYSILQSNVLAENMKKLQIMFMSMGEPLLNSNNLIEAIRRLYDMYPHAALLISTIGPSIGKKWEDIFSISEEIPTVGLQFSIHKSTDEERNKLIPFKNKLTLKAISGAGLIWNKCTGRKPFFNYCAGDDNTADADVERLFNLFDPKVWECTISVICERNDGMPAKNQHQVDLANTFSQKMLGKGYNVRVFDPAGQDDIGGGCGQLWFVQDWMKNNPELARPSCGHDLPVIHTPV